MQSLCANDWLSNIHKQSTPSKDLGALNAEISLSEVKSALADLKSNITAGPDGPTHLALKNLPEDGILHFLEFV